jgi:SAM-dependent methyltransferase
MKTLRVGQEDDDAPLGPDAFPPSIVRALLAEFSQAGDIVLDPFAGHGTVLLIAEEMGRVPIGMEINPERVGEARQRLRSPAALIEADARKLGELDLPPVDLVLTSPPYMTRSNHPQDPMSGYAELGSAYDRYLEEMTAVLRVAAGLLRPSGHLLVGVADLWDGKELTPIAMDTAAALQSHGLMLESEIDVEWPVPPEHGERDVVLVLRPAAGPSGC